MANRQYPSLDQYVPQPPQSNQPPPSVIYYILTFQINFPTQGYAEYSHPPPANYATDYNSQYTTPPAPTHDQFIKSSPVGAPQAGLFQDMGFLQDAVYSQVSSRLLDNGRQYVDKNFGRFLTLMPLKYYFNVNNRYVFNKLRLLLFPFFQKNWSRSRSAHSDLHESVPPREDINAPDLYIPTMAFVTYILLVGLLHGTSAKFTPDVLGITATTGLVVLVLEICFIKSSFYLLNTRSVPFLDLLSYCGYAFVGLIVNILCGLAIDPQWMSSLSYLVPLYPGVCMAYFMFRSLGPVVPDMSGIPKMKTYLLIIAALQVCIIFFLGMKSW